MPNLNALWLALALLAALWVAHRAWRRLELSRAKHPSLTGHAKLTRRMAALLPFYSYDEREIFACDGAPDAIVAQRRAGFAALAASLRDRAPLSVAFSDSLASGLSDVQFTDNYRVPFQFRDYVREHLRVGSVVVESRGTELCDLDGNWAHDPAGSYGANLFGYGFYEECIAAGTRLVAALGPVLGPSTPSCGTTSSV